MSTFFDDTKYTFRLNAGQAGYRGQQLTEFYGSLSQSLTTVPGVQGVSCSSLALLGGGMASSGISIPGRVSKPDEHLQADQLIVSDTFFSAVGIPLLQGRTFQPSDTSESSRVAAVNERFARSFFADENPLGRIFKQGNMDVEIVGICANTKYWNLRSEVARIMYLPYSQWRQGSMCFQVRSLLPPLSLVPAVRKIVAAVDQTIPLTEVRTQAEQISRQLTLERLFAVLCGFMALLALLLSCIGLYGPMAYNVARRTNEIGVRIAIGARPTDVAWPIVRSALRMTAIGAVFGGASALGLTRLVRAQLYGVAPHDPVTLAGAILVLLTVAACAAWLPARRAARIDPMVALRCQ
jgi:predicted permease